MPKAEAKRRGYLRTRTIKPTPDTYMHVDVVKKKGPHGGRTVGGKINHDKRR